MNYSDILSFTIDATERLNEQMAGIIKSESAMKVSNESALYYSLATETFTEKVKEYAGNVWKFIKDLVMKIKNFIVSAYKKVKEFITKKIAAIKAKFAKKEGEANKAEAKPEENKTEQAHEAADDMRYFVGTSNLSDFDKINAGLKELFDEFDISEMTNALKQMSAEEISKNKEELDNMNLADVMNKKMMECANTLQVQKVSADKYSAFAIEYINKYNQVITTSFKIFGEATKKFENFANSLSSNSEISSEQASFAKIVATKMSSLIGKLTSVRSRAIVLDLALIPANGFISEEAAKTALDEYKEKIKNFF